MILPQTHFKPGFHLQFWYTFLIIHLRTWAALGAVAFILVSPWFHFIASSPAISVPPLSLIKEIIIVLLLQFLALEFPAITFIFFKAKTKVESREVLKIDLCPMRIISSYQKLSPFPISASLRVSLFYWWIATGVD